MNRPPLADEVISFPLEKGVKEVIHQLEKNISRIDVEGLKGSSISLFLAHLVKSRSNPIVVLTSNQATGEKLIGDLKYFFKFYSLDNNLRFYPSWDILPYESLSPSLGIMGERLEVLNLVKSNKISLLVVPVDAFMQCVIPQIDLSDQVFSFAKGESLEREYLETCLFDNGFVRVPMVQNRGEVSIRGDIVDVYPPASNNPIRIEFYDNTIESLREFDVNSQVSLNVIDRVEILPVREVSPNEIQKGNGLDEIAILAKEHNVDPARLKELNDKIHHLKNFPGMEILAPFFYSCRETLFDYLSKETLIVLDDEGEINSSIINFERMVNEGFNVTQGRGDLATPVSRFYLDSSEIKKYLDNKNIIIVKKLNIDSDLNVIRFDFLQNPNFNGKFNVLVENINKWKKESRKVILVASTKGQVKRIHELLNEYNLSLDVDRGYISTGFNSSELNLVFVAEHEVFGRTQRYRYRRKSKSQIFQRGFKDLKPGDYLVHVDYGIGRYMGTRELEIGDGCGEFLNISYADDEKLYIPMDGLSYIQKYIGSGSAVPILNKLGSVSWRRQKSKIKESIREMAEDLLKLYASREIAVGTSYSTNPILMQEFSDSFGFEETEDQLKAIDETMEDLESSKTMDRLICGDVGYGKTEVAMRAAFKVVLDKKQVAVLVPTTVLAQQHLLTFSERFKNYAVNIDMVNRFKSPREQKQILKNVKSGAVDIIIGTHRLLSKDVDFAQLGLIIIDEEQRFGVKHKEAMKKIRNKVDILTLTATPIPRTLHFSLMGVRDLSVIESPPVDRRAIKTYIHKFDEKIIREAILKELDRGGQIYFVHNKIKSINSVKEMIQKIVPGVTIGIGHGQLPEHQLEEVMGKFVAKKIDVLLCTTIIESGLDIPSANTIIINRADQFGLAQLYQLRGRVGRYKHQAYAYLLIPGALAVNSDAKERLIAIEELSELGAGFQLAARDMEIRGIGNMLGHNQSGHIASIGFDLYTKLMEDTVKNIKGEKVGNNFIEPEINLQIKGYIPKDYITDLNQRLDVYRRLQLLDTLDDCSAIKNELIDRYGVFSTPIDKLMELVQVKVLCKQLHISKVCIVENEARINMVSSTPVSPEKLIMLVDKRMRFLSEFCLGIKLNRKNWANDLLVINDYLKKIIGLI